jgi:aminoglycoside phosphotransferase (APT) family kinase protein
MSSGGGLTSVERRGDTVRRSVGDWAPAVHTLLRHLETVEFGGAPRDGGVVCHNDLSPDNTVYEPAGKPRAFIDWDLAAPAPPLWDLAWAAYRFVPL